MHKVEFDEYKEIYAELKNQFMDFNNSYDPETPPYQRKGKNSKSTMMKPKNLD